MFSDPQPVFDELRASYGPVVGLGFGPARMAIIGGPAEVRSLFTRPAADFRWNHKFNALAVVVGKQSMITSDGDDWARRRGAVQTAFSRRRLNGWIPMIIEQADTAIDALPADGRHQVDLYRVGRAAILEIVVRAFFGTSMADRAQQFGALMQRPQDYLELPAWKQIPHPFPLGKRGRVRADRRAFDDLVREAMAAIRDNPSHDPDDVLEVLVHDERLSEQEILDQVNTLVGAGFDTTAASLAWMFWCCGLDPDTWPALRNEADVVLGSPGEHRTFDHATLNRLEVADRVVKETLRLHPAGVISPREAARDLDISGYTITKGTLVLWSATSPAGTRTYGTTPSDSTPTGSSTSPTSNAPPPTRHGSPSAADAGTASASRSPRWSSPCSSADSPNASTSPRRPPANPDRPAWSSTGPRAECRSPSADATEPPGSRSELFVDRTPVRIV